jgi:hypothetical protein
MLLLISTFVFGLLFQTPASQPAPPPEAVAKAFLDAFIAGDVTRMKEHFADKVHFVGDLRFLGEQTRGNGERDVTREQLAAAYRTMLDAMGREKWTSLTKQLVPSLNRATKNGGHPEDLNGELPAAFVKTGEFLFELKFPNKTGLDDILLFVLKPEGGALKITSHWADY